jgi:hypothetical protein
VVKPLSAEDIPPTEDWKPDAGVSIPLCIFWSRVVLNWP